jgi:hypothetical protein
VYSSRGVKGGVERTAEEHFDPDALRDNPAYDAELKGSAAGILALPLDQQIKYISNTLGWPTIKQSEWAGATPKIKESFLMEQRFEKDLQKLMGAGGKNRVKTRDATSSDVAAYKADGIELDLLNEDGTPTKVYYTSKGNPTITPYKTSDSKTKTNVDYIDKMELPMSYGPKELQKVNIDKLGKSLGSKGFTSKNGIDSSGEFVTVTKSVAGADRTVNIYNNYSEKQVKDLLRFLETGDNASEKVGTKNKKETAVELIEKYKKK